MTPPLSERQQLKLLLETTSPPTTQSALDTPISPTSYLTWTTARRRAWDRRHTAPNSYFFHYLHPSLSPSPARWSLREHRVYLAALQRAPPSDQWGLFSLLVPGRVGTDCRRYYHRIGRAGFITLDGNVRNRLVARAKIVHGKNVLQSSNPLFLRRSLRKFIPASLPHIDDSLYASIEKPPLKRKSPAAPVRSSHDPGRRRNTGYVRDTKPPRGSPSKSQSAGTSSSGIPAPPITLENVQDLLTYVPAKPSEHNDRLCLEHDPDKENSVPRGNEEKSESVLCRLKIRDSTEKRKLRSRSSSLKTKVRSSCKTKVASHATSGRAKDGPVRAASVPVKLRTTSPSPISSSIGAASQLLVNSGSKRKQPNKAQKTKRSNKTSKNDKKEEKQNKMPDLPQSSRESRAVTADQIPRVANTAKLVHVLSDSRKQTETNNGKQSDGVGLPPRLNCTPPLGEVTNLKRRPVKPLKPILRPRESSKKIREKGKTVHFSPIEGQAKESPTRNDDALEMDGTEARKKPNVDADIIPQGDTDHDQIGFDPKIGNTDPKISKTDDSSRCTRKCLASGNALPALPAACHSANNANKPHADVKSSVPVSPTLENGYGGHLSGVETVREKDTSTSSDESKHHTKTPHSSKVTKHPHLGCAETPPGAEVDVGANSGQPSASMSSTRRTTPEQLHVGSLAEDSEKHSFGDTSRKRVETIQTEHSGSGTESHSTGTDGEFLDMEVVMDTPPGNQTELFDNLEESGEPGTKLRNTRRITGPTREDRTSIGFLMNEEDAEPHPKKRRVGTDETFVDNGVCDQFDRAVSLVDAERNIISSPEEGEECRDSQGGVSVENIAPSKTRSEYQLMQTRIEQTRLMLSLFVDMVDPVGEQLGHRHQRRKLLASFDETFQRLQVTEGHAAKKRPLPISSLMHAANTAGLLDNRCTRKQTLVHLGGLTHYWGSFVDSYIGRIKDMEIRQKVEVESKRIADSFY